LSEKKASMNQENRMASLNPSLVSRSGPKAKRESSTLSTAKFGFLILKETASGDAPLPSDIEKSVRWPFEPKGQGRFTSKVSLIVSGPEKARSENMPMNLAETGSFPSRPSKAQDL
jgi:hypothetical protein